MRQATILIMVLAAAVGCAVDDDDNTDLSASEEESTDSTAAPTHDPTGPNCPGGSGGPEPSGKKPIPDAKDCSQILDPVECRDCCEWNVDKVWGERCRRMPKRTDEQKRARRACWEDAERRRANCHSDCPIEILTLTVTP